MPHRRYARDRYASPELPGRRTGRPRRWRPTRALLRVLLLALVLVFLAGSAAVAWVSRDLPTPGNITDRAVKESTKITDRTGTTLLYEIGEVRRTRVKLSEVSPVMVQATVAAEDRDFYRHRGIDPRGIVRALVKARPGRRLQGGSTITQQLVKNALLTPERTFTRKLKEQLLALAIEQRHPKDEILEMYLNEIPYGANAYGVEAAARTYFGTTARDLSLAQASLLASLPKAPTYYSPFGSHREELFTRQQHILEAMVDLQMVTAEEAEAAKRVPFHFTQRREPILAPHFVFHVRELLEAEYGRDLVESGGLKVTTTLDLALQRAAEDAISAQAPQNRAFGARNAALTALNPKNGDLLAMVGSVDYFDTENDGNVNVATRPRSPGSSFKPVVYAEAFRKGFTPNTLLADVPIEFAAAGKSYQPKNFDLKFRGPVTMRQALAQSLNVPSVQALYLAGVEDTVALARRLGYHTLTDPDRYGLSLVLGGGEVRLLDAVSAFGVLAREGHRVPPRAILKVEAPDGTVLADATTEEPVPEAVLDPDIARLVTDILADNAARAPMFGARSHLQLGERPVAAKTGTTQDFRDGWTLGYTPDLVAGVWVGNNDNTPMKREPGVYTAAPIWNAFMRKALEGTPLAAFTSPPPLTTAKPVLDGQLPTLDVRYEPDTEIIVPKDCALGVGRPRTFIEFRSILHYVRREDPRGEGVSGDRDPQYAQWEKGIAAWREKDNRENPEDEKHYVEKLPEPTCDAAALEGRPSIVFRSPADHTIRKSPVKVAVDIEAPSPVTTVEFFAGETKIGERTQTPWEALYRFGAGFHGDVVFRVRAVTEEGKANEVRRTIRVNPDTTLPKVELLRPRNRETLSPASFPYTLTVKASDPSGIAEVDVLYSFPGDARQQRAGRVTLSAPGRPDRFAVLWEVAPAPGTYALRARARDATGNLATTAPITIVIP